MRKRRVLLVWWEEDHRPEFLRPFIEMSNDIEFIQLIYKNKKERTTTSSPFRMIYWFDYVNAQGILKDLKPDIILGVTEGIFSAALINASKRHRIPFYGLQHGFSPENVSAIIINIKKFGWEKVFNYIRTTFFFLMSFSIFKPGKFFSALYFYWLYLRTTIYKILHENSFPWLVPDYYICFSKYSAQHYMELYRMPEERIKYIGVLWFDKFFKQVAKLPVNVEKDQERYYLLIDTTFVEYPKPVTESQINRCYQVLSDFCQAQGARLKVKLHPWNYGHTYLLQHPNIDYVRKLADEELYSLIAGSEGCFGFYSTLTFPILAIKPVVQVQYDGIYLKLLEEKGLTPVIDFYSFTTEDIHFPGNDIHKHYQSDLEFLLFNTDGAATERLKQILIS